jgi:hypothetical protein
LADCYEHLLETIIPHDAEGKKLRRKFHLPPSARWKHAIAAGMVRRAIESTEAAQQIANRVEGKVTQSVAIDRPLDFHITVSCLKTGDDEKL